MSGRNHPVLRGLAVLLLTVLSACKPPAPQAFPEQAPAREKNALTVGVLLPLSGAQASFGTDAVRGVELAVQEINARGGVLGRPFRMEIRDTRSEESTTIEAVRELAAESSLPLIIGEITSLRTRAAAHEAQALGIPLLAPAATQQDLTTEGDGIFRSCYADPFPGVAMAKFADSLEANRAAVLEEENNPYSKELADNFVGQFQRDGGTLVARETFQPGDPNLRERLEAVKAATPDVIFLPSYYPEAAEVVRTARQLGIETPFLGGDGWDSPEFLRQAGTGAKNCYFSNHFSADNRTPENEAFIVAFTEKYGAPPPPLAALAYDATRLAAAALEAAQSTDRAAVRDALAATRDFPGVTGTISYGSERTPQKPAIILSIQDGQFRYLETVQPDAN